MLQQISFLLQNWKQMTKLPFLFKVWSMENTIGRYVDVVMVWKNLIYVNWITHTNGETFQCWSIWKIYSWQSISELFGCCSIYANSLHPKDQETGSLNCIRSQSTRFISVFLFSMMQFLFRLSKFFLLFQNPLVGLLVGSTRKCIGSKINHDGWECMSPPSLSCLGGLRVSWIHFRWWKTETQNTMISKWQTRG